MNTQAIEIVRKMYNQFFSSALLCGAVKVPRDVNSENLFDVRFMPPSKAWIDPQKNKNANTPRLAMASSIDPAIEDLDRRYPGAKGKSVLAIRAASESHAEVLIYGPVGDYFWDGISAKQFVEELRGITATHITVRINSDGGIVSDGVAIHNALKSHPAKITTVVDGLAASIASLVFMAGDTRKMYPASSLMLHAPWTWAAGNAKKLRKLAEDLETTSEAVNTAYLAHTTDAAAVEAMLTDGDDHYLTAARSVELGLATELATTVDPATTNDNAAAAALLSLISAIAKAPGNAVAALRDHIHAQWRPNAFASLSEAHQRAVLAHIEDPTMQTQSRLIMANAGGALPAAAPTPPPAVAAAPAAPAPVDHHAAALAAVADRNNRIHAALRDVMDAPGINQLYTEALRDPTMTVETVQARALAALGAQASPSAGGSPRIEGGADERDRMVAGISNAVLARSGLAQREDGNQYNGIRMQQIARIVLQRAGVSGLDRMNGEQLFDRMVALHGSSDFPLLLANTANKALRAAYEAAPQTWRAWCAVGEVSDFKANSRIQLGTFNSLAEIKPGGEYTYGNLGEEAESIQAITKGKGIAFTRQMMINDDLGAFIGASRMVGMAAQRTVNEDVYTRLFASTVMSDTGALFNATAVTTAGGHANLAGSGAAISATSLAAAEAAMALQKDKNLRTPLNLTPRYLLVPRAKRQVAYDVLKPFGANTSGSTFVQDMGLTLISDSLLDANSTTAWFLVADQNIAPLIEVDFLYGNEVPYVAESIDWETDAMKLKVRLDYGVQAIDWRAGYKNPGA